jgi:hypothetical protein
LFLDIAKRLKQLRGISQDNGEAAPQFCMCCEDPGAARYIVEEVSDERRCDRTCFSCNDRGACFFCFGPIR